jgi:IS5 family transposase
LDIKGDSDTETYVSERTLWTMRQILSEKGLAEELFTKVTEKLVTIFKVDASLQRLDATHIFSNMRHLGRIGLFAATIKKFLINLKRGHREIFDALDSTRFERYLKKSAGVFALVKPSESAQTLQGLAEDLFFLLEHYKEHEQIRELSSYKLLARLLREQCLVQPASNTTDPKVEIKPNKEITSDSLQNPSDPDAGYSGHKGKGYQVQLMETYQTSEKDELSLITHVAVEPANVSDVHALIPAIEATQKKGLGPQQVVADTLYGSDKNSLEAAVLGVDLVAPALGKPTGNALGLEDFTLDANGTVSSCPQALAPAKTSCTKSGNRRAVFDRAACVDCLMFLRCPARIGEGGYEINYDQKQLRLTCRRGEEKTTEFKDTYRYRSGIEASNSRYKSQTGVKRLRVRGLAAVTFSAVLKAIALNILRAAAFSLRTAGPEVLRGAHFIDLAAHAVALTWLATLWGTLRDDFRGAIQPSAALMC